MPDSEGEVPPAQIVVGPGVGALLGAPGTPRGTPPAAVGDSFRLLRFRFTDSFGGVGRWVGRFEYACDLLTFAVDLEPLPRHAVRRPRAAGDLALHSVVGVATREQRLQGRPSCVACDAYDEGQHDGDRAAFANPLPRGRLVLIARGGTQATATPWRTSPPSRCRVLRRSRPPRAGARGRQRRHGQEGERLAVSLAGCS